MTTHAFRSTRGFTLIEVLIGAGLSLMIMAAVLSSYVFVGRSFARSFGISSGNGATLESQGRRTLAYFTRDVEMASGLDTSAIAPKVAPSANGMTLVVPLGTGSTTITYVYDSVQKTLTRLPEGGSAQVLHSSLLSPGGVTFSYFDASGHPYTSYVNYLSGIRQISVSISAQAGSSVNGTLTQIYEVTSPRVTMRNKSSLP